MSSVLAFQILVYLIMGFILTNKLLRVTYESFSIDYNGNVWVNWFGVSFLLYFFYTMIRVAINRNNRERYKERTSSIIFWLLFLSSLYVVFIPFIKGENPF